MILKKNSWHCPCAKTQRSCTHKYIAKWHLLETNAELFGKVRSTERSAEEFQVTAVEESDGTHVGENTYPPKDALTIQGTVQYILMNKKIPSTIPNHLRLSSVDKEFPRHLIPEETLCYHCPNHMVLSDPICITQKANILTTSGIVQGGLFIYVYGCDFVLLIMLRFELNHSCFCTFCVCRYFYILQILSSVWSTVPVPRVERRSTSFQ